MERKGRSAIEKNSERGISEESERARSLGLIIRHQAQPMRVDAEPLA